MWVKRSTMRISLFAGRVRKIYCGLRRLDPSEGAGSQDDVVLAVNPFQPHKNLIRIVDAVETLRTRTTNRGVVPANFLEIIMARTFCWLLRPCFCSTY